MDIQRVQQSKDNNCFDACIEMLTGIDQDLFNPDDTPQTMTRHNRETKQITSARFAWQHESVVPTINTWRIWFQHLGYDMKVHTKRPRIAAIRVVNGGTHAVVELPNGMVLDPGGWGSLYDLIDLWVTIEPARPMAPIRL